MTLFERRGPTTRKLLRQLRRRRELAPEDRPAFDCSSWPKLVRREAVVFTDTADFTVRTVRDGILHFLMSFDRVADAARKVVRASGGRVIKVEGDSLLLAFDDVVAACAGVQALEAMLRSFNRSVPANEGFRFSYGIGYGELVQVDGDRFGLELNLASKLGEDLAKPGEALLTPAAVAALDRATRRRVVPYRVIAFKKIRVPVRRLRL